MTISKVTVTVCNFRGEEFKVSVREREHKVFTLHWVSTVGRLDGSDLKSYPSFNEAHAAGVRIGRAAIAELQARQSQPIAADNPT